MDRWRISILTNYPQIDNEINGILKSIEGFVASTKLNQKDIKEILELEEKAEKLTVFGMVPAKNQGVRNVLKKELVYVVAYYPIFFSNYKDISHSSSVIMTSGKKIIGEEIIDIQKLNEYKKRNDVVIIGSSFVLYTDKIRKSKSEAIIVLPERPFHPFNNLSNATNIISGSPSPPVDNYLKLKMNVDGTDPNIGTVLVGLELK